ncbi:MAG TPA: hypothetical protein DIT35_09940 [Rhodospirillaceae bacterium]|nr:hypothetical protein [Rhodospirillaceae bacterium]
MLIAARRFLGRLFSERSNFIARAHGCVRYLRLNRAAQVGTVVLTICILSWSVLSTVHLIAHIKTVPERDKVIAQLRAENEQFSQALDGMRARVRNQHWPLTSGQKNTVDLETGNRAFRLQVEDRKENLVEAEMSRRRIGEQPLLGQDAIGKQKLGIISIEAGFGTSHERLPAAMKTKEEENVERLGPGDLTARLVTLETAQVGIVSRLGETANESGKALRKTLQLAGLNVDRLLDRMARSAGEEHGIGGPLLSVEDSRSGELAQQIAAAERRIDDLRSMHFLMEHIPLAAPLDEYHVTSNFGRRIDPFTKELAFHAGTDMTSRQGAAVRVTSPGVVTFVGWKGGFGKMVEVDHGLGVRTRYGHLATIFVKRGQALVFREKVGRVGSTGRSSGEHLHYEILIDGRQKDPANFIKAGRYVFKN